MVGRGSQAKEFTLAAVTRSARLQRVDPKALALGHQRKTVVYMIWQVG